MAILSKGTDFSTGDQVSATNLDNLVDNATFAAGAVDGSTTTLSGLGEIIVKDNGITTQQLESAANGQLFIGNGSGFTKATLTAGSSILITNGSGSINIATSVPITQIERCTAQVDVSTYTWTDITGMTATVAAGTYLVEATIVAKPDDGSGGLAGFYVRLTGTSVASSANGSSQSFSTSQAFNSGVSTASLPVESTKIFGGGADVVGNYNTVKYSLVVVVGTGGTLKWQARPGEPGYSVSVKLGSYMKITAL